MRDFSSEYLAGAQDLLAHYAGPPQSVFDRPLESRPWDEGLVEGLRRYQTALEGGGLISGDEAVVITGQQPGLFTGPLYTIYKAVTAIGLARKLAEKSGAPCLPIFWVGSEDHDFEEARSAHFLTRNHETLSFQYEPKENVEALPMYEVRLDDSLHAFIDEAAEESPGAEFHEDIAALLHEQLNRSSSLADWTARLLAALFRDTPLVLFAPHLPEARLASMAILEQEIREPLASTVLLNQAAKNLQRLDFEPQVIKGPKECNFFIKMGERRRKVLFEKNRFWIPDEDINCTVDELTHMLHASPERFSPNVALRCIVQQHLFPTAAYVAGPGELAYWAQLKPLFEHFGQTMPIVYPRARATLTTLKLNKIRAKLGLTLDDLTRPQRELKEKVRRNTSTNPAYAYAKGQRTHVEEALRELAQGLKDKDHTAASMAESLLEDLVARLDKLERAILQGDGAKNDATLKQLERLCTAIAPWRKPQERVYTVFTFLFQYGYDVIARLIEELDIESFSMTEIEL